MKLSVLLDVDESRLDAAQFRALLWAPIATRTTFRDCLLPVKIAGETRWWSLTGKAVFDSNARFTGYRGVGSDVTAAKLAEERLSHLARFDSLTPREKEVLDLVEAAARGLLQHVRTEARQ